MWPACALGQREFQAGSALRAASLRRFRLSRRAAFNRSSLEGFFAPCDLVGALTAIFGGSDSFM
ncbi:MAG: hypothetical protein RL145_2252 [Pseudomonadota bacterium]